MSSEVARAEAGGMLLGQLLLAEGLIGAADLERALELQARIGGRLGGVLMRIGALSEDNLIQVLGRQLELPVLGQDVRVRDEDAVRRAAAQARGGRDWLIDQHVLAWRVDEQALFCAARDPLSPPLREAVGHAFPGQAIAWCLCRSQDLERMLDALA